MPSQAKMLRAKITLGVISGQTILSLQADSAFVGLGVKIILEAFCKKINSYLQ